MIAIIPAAGQGTRMSGVTDGRPKELLPLGKRSVLARIIDEALDAGAEKVVVVTSPAKPEIAEAVSAMPRVQIAVQNDRLGLAHAIACADVCGDSMIALGDVVFHDSSPLERMSRLIERGIDGAVAVEQVDESKVGSYGIVEIDEGIGAVRRILEKPRSDETPSRWAVAGRYALSRPLMERLGEYVRTALRDAPGNEVDLTGFLNALVGAGADIRAVALTLEQQRLDCGSPSGYEQARRLRWD